MKNQNAAGGSWSIRERLVVVQYSCKSAIRVIFGEADQHCPNVMGMYNRCFPCDIKIVLCILLIVMINFAKAQNVTFTQNFQLLNPVAGFVNFSDCVVDMNNDYLDDVVRVGEKGLFIDYQQKDGSFRQRQFSIPIQSPPTWSICAGDIDNNGYNDLLFGHSASVSFIKSNHNGTVYLEIVMPDSVQSQRSTMVDINNDGWLDGFVCNDTAHNFPYRNLGNGVMLTDTNLIHTADRPGNYSAIWIDYDNDHDIDLYLSKCLGTALPGDIIRTNLLYRNNGDGTFTEVAGQAGVDDNAQSWSTAFEDFDNDGDIDAFVVNHDMANRLYRNNGDGTFTDVITSSGIDPFDFGAFENSTGDFNNDGNVDIFSELTLQLYLGNGDLTFTGQGLPFTPGGIGDLNNDGFLDVSRMNNIWLNQPNGNHWVKVNTLGLESNRNGIGSRVEIYGLWGVQIREVRSGQSFSPMSSLNTHFGLGQHSHIDSLIVRWHSGMKSKIVNLSADTTYLVVEAECQLPGIFLDVTSPLQLCEGETISIKAPDGFSAYEWSNGDTTQWVVISEEGNYFALMTDSSGCLAVTEIIAVEHLEEINPEISSLSGTYFCEGDTITLLSTPGENYRWSTGDILTQQIAITQSGIFTVSIDAICFDGQITSDPFEVIALNAPSPQASDVFLLPGDSVLLTATGENIHWYDQPSGGILLETGNSFQTSALHDSVTYYIESHLVYGGELQSGGKPDTTGPGGLPEQGGHLFFETWDPFILLSVDVFVPEGAPLGVRFVQLYSNDSLVGSKSFTIVRGWNTLELNFNVGVGKHILTSPQGNLYRNIGDLDYPYPVGDAGQITGSSNGDNYYYYFYNWQIEKEELTCISERIPVNVIVNSDKNPDGYPGIKIYPNPADNILIIQTDTEMSNGIIRIMDCLGNEFVLKNINEGKFHALEIQHLPSGNYFLQIVSQEISALYKVLKL